MHDEPVDVREDAEGGEADSHESQSTDETNSHVILPIFCGLVGVIQFNFDASIRLDKTIAFAKVNNVELFLQLDQQVVDASRYFATKLG